jgi:signal transduction histidine kinase
MARFGILRLPRRTLRTQLTLLYAVPFFASAAVLLSIPLLGFRDTVPARSPVGASYGPPLSAMDSSNLPQVLRDSGIGLAALVVVSLALGWLVAGRFLRPLRTITATARDISANNLHRRLSLPGTNEFTELGRTLDGLFERLEASFASQRHFVANASHELRTPLTAERTLLQVALADPDATTDTLRATCEDLLALGEAQERLIEALLTLAVSERGVERREPFDLADIAGDVLATRDQEARRRGIHVYTALSAAPATGDPRLVESLVTNLVDNALRHNVSPGRVEVATTTDAGQARITVRNTGTVIPPDQVERLFQPFQQLGNQRIRQLGAPGHGLGLAIVRAIAGAHGATLVPRARPEGGLDIDVSFPTIGPRHPHLPLEQVLKKESGGG